MSKAYNSSFPVYNCETCLAKRYGFCVWIKGSNECEDIHYAMLDFKIPFRTKEEDEADRRQNVNQNT